MVSDPRQHHGRPQAAFEGEVRQSPPDWNRPLVERRDCKRVVLLGPFGYGNLGDAAIQQAVMHNLRVLDRKIDLAAISLNPADTEDRHGLRAFPIRREELHQVRETRGSSEWSATPPRSGKLREMARKVWILRAVVHGIRLLSTFARTLVGEGRHIAGAHRFLRGKHLLMVSGGGQLDEQWGGAWQHPYALLKWTILARLNGLRVAFVSVGVGRIDSLLTRTFLRWALGLAHYRSFRDHRSVPLVEKRIHVRGKNRVVPDMAFGLPTNHGAVRNVANGETLVVGVGPLSYYDPREWAWPQHDATLHERYVARLTECTIWLLEQRHTIVFFASEIKDDRPVIEEILRRIRVARGGAVSSQIVNEPAHDVDTLLKLLQRTDLVIASRFHGVLLSLMLGKPVVGISYERKVAALMEEMGLERFCVGIESFDVAVIARLVRAWKDEAPRVCLDVERACQQYAEQVRDQFRHLLGLCTQVG